MRDYSKIFNNKKSVFDNMDTVLQIIAEAAEEDPNAEAEGEEGEATSDDEMGEEQPEDPTMGPSNEQQPEGEPADEGDGIYVSSNEKAVLAKTMLDALQAEPPKPGEIPENLLNVTDANADQVIKYIQSLTSLSNATALADNGDEAGLVDTLKNA